MNWTGIAVVGVLTGLSAGLFGKGGSALATPLLHAMGVPAIVALAAPLPAAIPSTVAGSAAYWREHLLDRQLVVWSIAFGVPATLVGAWASRWVSGTALVKVTDLMIALLGIRFLLARSAAVASSDAIFGYRTRLVLVAAVVGLSSGLLANSGGFLLAPLYLAVLRRPIKTSFACSLAVAAVLAVPGTIVHWALGHIDWRVVAVFATTSIPFSYAGARVGVRMHGARLERFYGAAMTVLGVGFLLVR
jgi:uncharacterized membrane protein YfcA